MASTKPEKRSKTDKRTIEYVTTASLTPYARNSRTHSPQQVKQIAASIKEFGFTNPILIDESNGIIAGHGRVMAAEHLQLAEVPCIRLEHLTETQKRAYVIADNKLALNAGWDDELLNIELTDLHDAGFDVGMIGFEADELSKLMGLDEKEVAEDEVPEPPAEPITKPGDLWVLGEHRLLCGDSTKADDVGRLMNEHKWHALVCSPPYNQGNSSGDLASHGKRVEKLYMHGEDNKSSDEYKEFCWSILRLAATHSADVHAVVWNVAYNAKSRREYGEIVFSDRNPFRVQETICWDKNNAINLPQIGIVSRRCEFVFVMSASDDSVYRTSQTYGDCRWNYWNVGKPTQILEHKATYPVGLAKLAITWFSLESDTIYEPFCGSGTTLIAAEQLGRKCYGMEISPAYCDVIVQRWETLTGKKAVLENA